MYRLFRLLCWRRFFRAAPSCFTRDTVEFGRDTIAQMIDIKQALGIHMRPVPLDTSLSALVVRVIDPSHLFHPHLFARWIQSKHWQPFTFFFVASISNIHYYLSPCFDSKFSSPLSFH